MSVTPLISEAEMFEIGLVVATETGRDLAADAKQGFRAQMQNRLGREPSESELAEALYVTLHDIAEFAEEHALTKGISREHAMECRLAVLEAFDARMAGAVQ